MDFDLSAHFTPFTAVIGSFVLLLVVMAIFQMLEPAGKKAPPPVYVPPPPITRKDFTEAELKEYNGENGKRIYIACNGYVYDVSSHPTGPSFYGPGQHYNCFTGRDATIMFARMALDPAAVAGVKFDELSYHERDVMRDWQMRLETKYDIVGYLTDGVVPRSIATEAAKQTPAENKTD